MSKLRHAWGAIVVALALAFATVQAPQGASAQTVDEIIKRGKALMALDTSNPPFSATGKDGQPEGYEPDVSRLLAKYLGVEIEFVPATPQNRIAYLLTSRVDMMMIGITAERAKQVWFSMPYATDGAVLVGPASLQVKTLADLAGKRIGIPRGAMQDIVLSQTAPQGANIMRFDNQAMGVQALISGQVDLAGTGMLAYQILNRDDPGKNYETKLILRPLHFGIGIRRGNSDLLQWLNTFIYTIKNNGELEAISRKWRQLPLGDLPVF
ncbi:MAG: transporter substrate-binding domain-containing protein [Proteobacteria bacterium]|nr:transporter substrate-binding domain-containing protein [Pseudomonadota bacterium]